MNDLNMGINHGLREAADTLDRRAKTHRLQAARNKQTRSWEGMRLEKAAADALEAAARTLRERATSNESNQPLPNTVLTQPPTTGI